MNNKRILIDANVIIQLYESEYRCKNWQISSYFESILNLIEEGKIIVIPDVIKEVKGITTKPKTIEAKKRYYGYHPDSIMKIFEESGKKFINSFLKDNINIFDSLISLTVEQKEAYEKIGRERELKLEEIKKKELFIKKGFISSSKQELEELRLNKRNLEKRTVFKEVFIDKNLERWLINHLEAIYGSQNKLNLGEFLAKLSSTIDLSAKQTKTVDMKIGIYSVLNNLCISTYDSKILNAFRDSGQDHLIIYQHYLFRHFNPSHHEERINFLK